MTSKAYKIHRTIAAMMFAHEKKLEKLTKLQTK
jgi:hypothetical protein